MSRKYKFHNPEGIYFVTLTVNSWIDVFLRNDYKHEFIDCIRYCQENKGLEVFAYCIMTSHVHMIIRAVGDNKLPDIMRDLKTVSSKKIVKSIKENPKESRREWLLEMLEKPYKTGYKFWQIGSHPIEIWTKKVAIQKRNYIHQNPVEEGLVLNAFEYPFSSARDYAGNAGYIKIIQL